MTIKTLQSGEFSNVLLAPWQIARVDELTCIKGGLAFPGKFPAFARHHRGNRIVDADIDTIPNNGESLGNSQHSVPAAVKKLAGRYIWGGCYHQHFGHFTAEFVHRLWLCNTADHKCLTVLFCANSKNYILKPFFKEIMALFNIQKWEIITEPTEIEHLNIGEQGKHLNSNTRPSYIPYLEAIAKKHNMAGAANSSDTNIVENRNTDICILRSHLKGARFAGEASLENFLISAGYTAYRPEDHSLIDQLKTITNADRIIMSEGSALHLFDLLPKIKARVAVLNRRPSQIAAETSLTGKVEDFYQFSTAALAYLPEGNNGKDPNLALTYEPMDKILKFLRANGFIKAEDTAIAPLYFEDFSNFIKTNEPNLLADDGNPQDTIVRLLLSELAWRATANRRLTIQNTYLKAKLALAEGDLKASKPLVLQYLWKERDSDKALHLKEELQKLEARQ